jgi:hypothetical protein
VRRALTTETLRDIWDDVGDAADDNGLDHPTDHISRTHMDLDREGYEEVVDMLNSVLDRAIELHAEAAPRLAALPPEEREEHSTAMALMYFHRGKKKRRKRSRPGASAPGTEASK